jgi:hypothetical protein
MSKASRTAEDHAGTRQSTEGLINRINLYEYTHAASMVALVLAQRTHLDPDSVTYPCKR